MNLAPALPSSDSFSLSFLLLSSFFPFLFFPSQPHPMFDLTGFLTLAALASSASGLDWPGPKPTPVDHGVALKGRTPKPTPAPYSEGLRRRIKGRAPLPGHELFARQATNAESLCGYISGIQSWFPPLHPGDRRPVCCGVRSRWAC